MPVSVSSSIVLGVKKGLVEGDFNVFKLEAIIAQYLEEVGVSTDFARWFFLMEERDLDVFKFISDYYHMRYKRDYIDSGSDLEQTDPGDDRLLQYFLQKVPKDYLGHPTDDFSCLVSIKDRKLFSHLTGETTFEEIDPISLKNDDLILLECTLYY